MQLQVGDIVEGKVTGVTNFGAFVDIGDGKTGMVHVSEVSNTYVKDINEFIKVGETVKAAVLTIDEKGKISLSIKKLLPPPERQQKFEAGSRAPRRQFAPRQPKPAFNGVPEVVDWGAKSADLSFEEMMSKYKQRSEERISDLKRSTESKRGSGYGKKR